MEQANRTRLRRRPDACDDGNWPPRRRAATGCVERERGRLKGQAMPKHARDEDAAEIGAAYKKGPALDESHQSCTPPPRRDKDRADDPEPPAPRGRVSGGGELGEGPGNDGDQDSQVRRQYIEWTLEDIDDKIIHVRYCSGALDSPRPPCAPWPAKRDAPGVQCRGACVCGAWARVLSLAHFDFILARRATAAVCRGV